MMDPLFKKPRKVQRKNSRIVSGVVLVIGLLVALQLDQTLKLSYTEWYEDADTRYPEHEPSSATTTGTKDPVRTAAVHHASNPSASPSPPSPAEIRIANLTDRLGTQNLRYYVYDNSTIEQTYTKEQLHKGAGRPLLLKRYKQFALTEIECLESLKQHRLRTRDPSEADLYVIPLSTAAILVQRNANVNFDNAFAALYATSTFQSTLGHRHVIMGNALPIFSPSHVGIMKSYGLGHHYKRLWNVTIANDMDPEEMRKIHRSPGGNTSDFQDAILGKVGYVTRSAFSVGLGASTSSPLVIPTLEKFQNASFLIFYQTRKEPSMFNSTQYRHAPPGVVQGLPKSSIGFGLNASEWRAHFIDSKFCLVIRGDTPSTHALLSSVRAGCIPVIICDLCSRYSPSFKSSLRIEDFSVTIDEHKFLQDPLGELLKLQEMMTTFEIEEKLKWLAYAQRITQPDHPKSLFVPAFVYESLKAQ
jgi:hypothetical protein